MTGLFCSIDFAKCALNYRIFCYRLFSFQTSQQTRYKSFSYLTRRCCSTNVKVISKLQNKIPWKLCIKDNLYYNKTSSNACTINRFASHRHLSSNTPNGKQPSDPSAIKEESALKGAKPPGSISGIPLEDVNKIGFETSLASGYEDRALKDFPPFKKEGERGRRMKTDFSKIYTDNILVPLSRVMPEYLLENNELGDLPKYSRRSPYPNRGDILVFKKKHLEKRAIDKWGSLENLQLQKDFLKARRDKLKKQKFSVRQELYSYLEDQETPYSIEKPYLYQPQEEVVKKYDSAFQISSERVVMFAVACNSFNCLIKLVAWLYTGSHSMFAEVIHSAADTINQVILAVGIKQSLKEADSSHPYGWAKFRNVSSLISGVGIFCVGSGLSFYHGVTGLLYPGEVMSMYWALLTLGASFVFEGGTLIVALKELQKGRKKANMSLKEYLTRGIDPTTTVVLMEDAAAVLGICIAGTAISITQFTGSVIPDAIGSLMIGTLLGAVASFIIYTNTAALVGRSIPAEKRLALVTELESDRMIRTLIDVKATEAGGRFVRFKAEVDFDGREVTRSYLEMLSMEDLLKEMKQCKSVEDAESFMLKHGENVIDALGSAVDRIETNLKKKHPEIRHCDLEQL